VSNARAIKQQPVVNGIDLENVNDLIETVKQNAREGLTQWKVTSTWLGRTHMRAKVEPLHIGGKTVERPFTIDIDEPTELGGAMPTQILKNI
jgi:hypothetical protein